MYGWQVSEIYKKNSLWKAIAQNNITIIVTDPIKSKQRVKVPIMVKNETSDVLTVTLSISAAANQTAYS
jgi:hypothetical protein